jgi:site-specific DNA-methyltransferase (cytosine-N4-specific)
MLLNALLKIKGDVIADVELPLAEGELRGLGVSNIRGLNGETAAGLLPLEASGVFSTIFGRKTYAGLTKFFFGTATWETTRALRERATYFSDCFFWPKDRAAELPSAKEVAARLGLPWDGLGGAVECGFAIHGEGDGQRALLHVVPVYWFIEYSSHALAAVGSVARVPDICDQLLRVPFSVRPSVLAARILGKNSYTTAHFTHGLHQYKGKFFPRMVRSLLNTHHPKLVVDPFCGSGTLQAEAMTSGYRSVGFDLNPLSVELCKMKSEILEADPDQLDNLRLALVGLLESPQQPQLQLLRDAREASAAVATFSAAFPEDLRSKLAPEDVAYAEDALSLIDALCERPYGHIFRMILSDALKSKVRVRVSGKTQFFYAIEPTARSIRGLFASSALHACKLCSAWTFLRARLGVTPAQTVTLQADARAWPEIGARPDLVITSPPYFPYTGISYVYTNLAAMAVLGIKDLRGLEASMVGNTIGRGLTGPSRLDQIPEVRELFSFLGADKFRRPRIPVYRGYFDDIGRALQQANIRCEPGAVIRLIIAKYQKLYSMKDKRAVHEIDCGRIISQIGSKAGLVYEGSHDIPLLKSDKVSLYPSNEGVETILTFRTKGTRSGW